ncbi:hypothetical protein ACNNMU_09410 [Aerococcus viridans]
MSTIDNNIKRVLDLIHNEQFDSNTSLPDLKRNELKNLILMCENEQYLSHRSGKNGQPLVISFMDGGWILHPSTFVTRSGTQFLEGFDRNNSQPSQTFNIQSVQNSALGNYNTVNNYSNKPIEDLQKYISELADKKDKEIGNELLETLKTEEIKPGFLNRFENFLSKHPKSVDLVASFVTSVAMSSITN